MRISLDAPTCGFGGKNGLSSLMRPSLKVPMLHAFSPQLISLKDKGYQTVQSLLPPGVFSKLIFPAVITNLTH